MRGLLVHVRRGARLVTKHQLAIRVANIENLTVRSTYMYQPVVQCSMILVLASTHNKSYNRFFDLLRLLSITK